MLFHGTRWEERAINIIPRINSIHRSFPQKRSEQNDFGVHRNSQLSPQLIDARVNQPSVGKSSRTTRPDTTIQVTRVIFGAFARNLLIPRQRRNRRHPSTAAWGDKRSFRTLAIGSAIVARRGNDELGKFAGFSLDVDPAALAPDWSSIYACQERTSHARR
jgi:hypothetical protein